MIRRPTYRPLYVALTISSAIAACLFVCLRSDHQWRRTNPVAANYSKRTAPANGKLAPNVTLPVRTLRACDSLPLTFESNKGQTAPNVQYVSHGAGSTLFLTDNSVILAWPENRAHAERRMVARKMQRARHAGMSLRPVNPRVRMRIASLTFEGANRHVKLQALDQATGTSNYFIGNVASRWRTGIPNYRRVRYNGIYPGIDLLFYGNHHRLEFDFDVAPETNPSQIRLKIDRREHSRLTPDGDLRAGPRTRFAVLKRPSVFQMEHGKKRLVTAQLVLKADGIVGIHVENYNPREALIVDPVLAYSTYLSAAGSSGEYGVVATGIAAGSSGNAYVAGYTDSALFPTNKGYQDIGTGSGKRQGSSPSLIPMERV